MNINKLIKILKEQKYNLTGLLKIVKDKQKILIGNKLKKLPDYISLEEKKLLEIQITEEKRLKIMKEIFSEYNIKKEKFKLEILTESLEKLVPNNILFEIKEEETKIKEIIKEVTKVNGQNLLLIQQSNQIISETVKAVIDSNNKAIIIDRKG